MYSPLQTMSDQPTIPKMNDPKENLLNLIGTLNQKLVALSPGSEQMHGTHVQKLRESLEELDSIVRDPKFIGTMEQAFCSEALGLVRESILMQKLTFNEGLIDRQLFSDLFKKSFEIYSRLKSQEVQLTGN